MFFPKNDFIRENIFVIILVNIILIIYIFLKGEFIFEFKILGGIFYANNYKWYKIKKNKKVFEMPKSRIVKFEIENFLMWKYLKIKFHNEFDDVIEVRFNLISCSEKQINKIHVELASFLVISNYNGQRL